MKKLLFPLIIAFLAVSCSNNNLKKQFDCNKKHEFTELKEYNDFLKHFKVELPNHWKTNLYYDDYSSEIFSADTTKGLSNSYILDIAWRQGELTIDDSFSDSLKDSLQLKEQLQTVKSGQTVFKKLPGFWNLSKGEKSGYTYNYLQVFVKTKPDEYITLTTKVYGDENVDERLCESISLFENLEISK
ncbi:MAG: hypothetical protein R2821_06265 [Flavobacteriaceae bacterium]|nr:hypothetical protein [Flavobacteriaceae bacterium]